MKKCVYSLDRILSYMSILFGFYYFLFVYISHQTLIVKSNIINAHIINVFHTNDQILRPDLTSIILQYILDVIHGNAIGHLRHFP